MLESDLPNLPGSSLPEAGDAVGQGTRPRRELRIALAMRGGVSLAVWIGGACAELDAVRRRADGDFYRRLLPITGYDAVTIDVISGASAGGLNGALLATALVRGVPFVSTKKLWLDKADLRKLAPKADVSDSRSVLDGDYFRNQVQRALAGLLEQPVTPETSVESLDLFLAGTLLRPVPVELLDDAGVRIEEMRRAVRFRFTHHGLGGADVSDFALEEPVEPAIERIATRLALAARSSSSFPAAFEPQAVNVERPPMVAWPPRSTAGDDMFGVFSEVANGPFNVMDGGVLDNIPVARAIEAVSAKAAAGPVERWLLFLHPSPDPGVAEEEVAPATDAWTTVKSAAVAAMGRESLLEDMEVLAEYNTRARRYGTLLTGVFTALSKAGGIGDPAHWYASYRDAEAAFGAGEALALMRDPPAALDEDPYPVGLAGGPLRGWREDRCAGLRDNLETMLRASLPAGFPDDGSISKLTIGALGRCALLLLEWARDLEARSSDGPLTIGALKLGLYETVEVVRFLDRYRKYTWPLVGRRLFVEGPPIPGVSDAVEFVRALVAIHPPNEGMAQLIDALQPAMFMRMALEQDSPPEPSPVAAAQSLERNVILRPARRYLPSVRAGLAARVTTLTPVDEGIDAITALWGLLRAYGESLRGIAQATPIGRRQPLAEWLEGRDDVLTALLLGELLTYPITAGRDAPTRPMRFLRISGANETPLARYFPDRTLDATRKLAGNDVANFAAFYRRSWRANDWMWGRVDAAKSIVDLVLRAEVIRASFMPSDLHAPAGRCDALLRELETLFVAPISPEDGWQRFLTDRWSELAPVVRAELVRVFDVTEEGEYATEDPPLDNTRAALTERRHWELVSSEIPTILRARKVECKLSVVPPIDKPDGLIDVLNGYRVGEESIWDDARTPPFNQRVIELAYGAIRAFSRTQDAERFGFAGKASRWLLRAVARATDLATSAVQALLLATLVTGLYAILDLEPRDPLALKLWVPGVVVAAFILSFVSLLLGVGLLRRTKLFFGIGLVGTIAATIWLFYNEPSNPPFLMLSWFVLALFLILMSGVKRWDNWADVVALSVTVVAAELIAFFFGPEGLELVIAFLIASFLVISEFRVRRTAVRSGLGLESLRRGFVWGAVLSAFASLGIFGAIQLFPSLAEHVPVMATTGALLLEALRVVFLTALPEEMIFRGVLQGRWSAFLEAPRTFDRATAVRWMLPCVISGAFFGLWHIAPTIDTLERSGSPVSAGPVLLAVGVTFAIGAVLLGPLRRATDSIVGCVILHASVNISVIAASYYLIDR